MMSTKKNIENRIQKLIESKANYYLKVEEEKGEGPPWILEEIEAMNDLLTYAQSIEAAKNREIESLQAQYQDLHKRWSLLSEIYTGTYQNSKLWLQLAFSATKSISDHNKKIDQKYEY